MYPKIYLGRTPASPAERRALRDNALNLHAQLRRPPAPAPLYLVLNYAREGAAADQADLVVIAPEALFVGAIEPVVGPFDILPDGRWIDRSTGHERRDASGLPPVERARRARELALAAIGESAEDDAAGPADRVVALLVCAPAVDGESRVSLDVDFHRSRIKVAGMDEIAALAAIVRTGARLDEEAMRRIAVEALGGQLWHDGERPLFEIAAAPYRLRVFRDAGRPGRVLPLLFGENLVGRRRTPLQREHRVTIPGDDLMSNDHAVIDCRGDGRVILHDRSTNGTWVALSDLPEEHLRMGERELVAGAMLRMGSTRMCLEPVEPGA